MIFDEIFAIKTDKDFEQVALKVFAFQAQHCDVYKQYLQLLDVCPETITRLEQIPFLPIQFFKTKTVYASSKQPDMVFTSSGTTGMQSSHHDVADIGIYERSFNEGFGHFYGKPSDYVILALLPSYLEREGSSLIYMVEHLIKQSGRSMSGFFLHNHAQLYERLHILKQQNTPTLLIGVSFALLDFIENYQIDFGELIVMETGGMKGRREELTRGELHKALCKGFGVSAIQSEYGMTELLSQAYSKGQGRFFTPNWLKILIRDLQDPFLPSSGTGGINVIDLANIYSCSFIETQDIGRLNKDGSFEILGRFDDSDVRGCNLMIGE